MEHSAESQSSQSEEEKTETILDIYDRLHKEANATLPASNYNGKKFTEVELVDGHSTTFKVTDDALVLITDNTIDAFDIIGDENTLKYFEDDGRKGESYVIAFGKDGEFGMWPLTDSRIKGNDPEAKPLYLPDKETPTKMFEDAVEIAKSEMGTREAWLRRHDALRDQHMRANKIAPSAGRISMRELNN